MKNFNFRKRLKTFYSTQNFKVTNPEINSVDPVIIQSDNVMAVSSNGPRIFLTAV